MPFNLNHDVFPLHLENQREVFYSPLKTSQRIKESAITSIAISPSQSLVACSTAKNIVRIIELNENYNGKLITRTEELSEFDITALCWTEDLAKPTLFIGDGKGRVYYLKLSFLSKNILNVPITLFMSLDSKIIQLCCDNDLLVISTLTRCYICDLVREHYKQIGQQLRDGLYGVTFLKSRKRIFCARPGSRLWEVDLAGDVHSTHQFKRKLATPPSAFISLFDEPIIKTETDRCPPNTSVNFVKLQDLVGRYIVTYNGDCIYVLNTDTVDVLFWCRCFGTVIDVQCSHSSIFIWNAEGDLHELVFLPAEKYVLTLYLKGYHELCVHVMYVLYEKLISSSDFYKLYPLKDFEWPAERSLGVDHDQKIAILAKIQEKLKTAVAKETKLNSGIHVVNNRHLSHRLLDDSVIDVHANGSNDEPRKRSNSLPSSLKKSSADQPQTMNGSEKLAHQSGNQYHSDADSELYGSPFVTFASYNVLRDNFSELGANFSQIFNDGSRNLKQKWQTFEGKITSRAEDASATVARVPAYYEDDEIVEVDDEPIVERQQTNTEPSTNDADGLKPLFNALELNAEDDDLFDALNVVFQTLLDENSHLPDTITAPTAVKDVFTHRCFVKPFLSAWFDSKTFPLSLPTNLRNQYPPMLGLLFDEQELKFDFLLGYVLVVFGSLLDGCNLLDTVKSFRLPCYYKSFCYVLKHFQRDQCADSEHADERVDWPTPVYLNTMLLMISVDRKDVFCEMGIKKNVDIVDVLYLLLHAVHIDSKNDSSLLPDYKNVWLNYIQKRHCEQNINCLENPNVFRLVVHALISCNTGLQHLCCSNCWFLLPQTLSDEGSFKSLSCAILDTFWSIFMESLNSNKTDYDTLLAYRCAVNDTVKYQPCSSVCYRDVENCQHLICKKFSEKVEQLQLSATSILAFDTICNLCCQIPFLWKYLSTVQTTGDSVQLLEMPHFIQLDNMAQLYALYPSSITADKAQQILNCLVSISNGCCTNCNDKVFDGDRVSWDNASTFVLQHLGAAETLKLLRCYSAAKINLSSSFYRSALLISLPKIGPDIANRTLSIVSNHCHSNYLSLKDFTELHAAYDRDNVSKKATCITASASDAHHWGISVPADHANQAICYCCSLPLFSKSLIKEYNGGITVFSCSHTYHTICLRNKNCALTCIVCDRFLR